MSSQARLVIDPNICASAACRNCQAASLCPTKALAKIDSDEPVILRMALCNACARCLPGCPHQALSIALSAAEAPRT